MAPIEVYGMQLSAPVRMVQMTCEVLGVEYEKKELNIMTGENMTPEFLKINPHHNIPAIKDGDFCLNESRAIAAYIANKYKKDGTIYPQDPETRGVVDQRLYFDMGTFYKAAGDIMYPVMFGGDKPGEKEFSKMAEVLGWVNGWAAGGKFMAGTETMTLADLAMLATYSTMEATGAFELDKYGDLVAWAAKMKAAVPNYEKANGEGATGFGGFYKSKAA